MDKFKIWHNIFFLEIFSQSLITVYNTIMKNEQKFRNFVSKFKYKFCANV